MEIKPIRSESEHRAAITEVERLWGAAPDSPESDRLEVLATLIDAYERTSPGLPELDPVELIRVTMAEEGYSQADLGAVLGSRSRASEILSRRRALTLPMVHQLSMAWRIPAALLIQPYQLDQVVSGRRRRAARR